jgi:hypothetical protein
MGACDSAELTPEERQTFATSKLIDKDIKKEIAPMHVCKILILGAADSGKSTFLKQIMFLYGNGLADEDYMKGFGPVLKENALQGMLIAGFLRRFILQGFKSYLRP